MAVFVGAGRGQRWLNIFLKYLSHCSLVAVVRLVEPQARHWLASRLIVLLRKEFDSVVHTSIGVAKIVDDENVVTCLEQLKAGMTSNIS